MTKHILLAVDITEWRRDEEFPHYPEGARDKTLVYSPLDPPWSFLLPTHRYLFKRSRACYPEQFWVESIAYHLGQQMDVEVPSAFPAFDRKEKQSGALIEWFYFPQSGTEVYIAGGDFCQQYIANFDRKKGTQHNFETVAQICEDLHKNNTTFAGDWVHYWAKAFVFDALIGNTDRHQDNWGIIEKFTHPEKKIPQKMRISPVFDNGTSMGYNIQPHKLKDYENHQKLEKYFQSGWHHIKWDKDDQSRMSHSDLLKKLGEKYPETQPIMLNCLNKVNFQDLKDILDCLVTLDIPVRLSAERAAFVLRLLQFRHQRLLEELDGI